MVTQEKNCREYALKNGYEVIQVFIEQGESAKTSDRTELKKLLLYCSDKKNRIEAIIAYKIDRISRSTDDYSQIRILLRKYGVEIKSVTEFFENTPAGRFMENIIANVAQFDNDVRAERCSGGMLEAVREGRYVWMAPVGYSNVRVGGKATIAKNEMAPLIKETFELVAKNTHAIEDVRKIMTEAGLVLKNGKPLGKKYFYKIFDNRLYYGVIHKFGETHKGLFEPVIDEVLFNQVRRVLKNRGKRMSQYKLDSEDFPLRRFVMAKNGRKLSGSWCKGRTKRYPYYRFGMMKDSNYAKDTFEIGFMKHMDKYRLDPEHIKKLKAEMKESLGRATQDEHKDHKRLVNSIEALKERQNVLIRKNIDGIIPDSVLKEQLELIEKELAETNITLASFEANDVDIDEAFGVAEEYLKHPSLVWKEAELDKKLKLQWFQFPQGIVFEDKNYETIELASIFKTKDALSASLSTVVDPRRIELLTSGVQNRRSTI